MEHDSPISVYGKGPTLAKIAVQEQEGHWPVPVGAQTFIRRISIGGMMAISPIIFNGKE